jgi:pyruvate dehydrogenase E1 component alpha subunit
MVLANHERAEMLRRLLRIRMFDEAACEQQRLGNLPGALHTSTGQEAAVVGACMALRPDDYLTGNHRSHGHPIAKGAALPPLMAELLGKKTGICKGKGGSMHLADFGVGSLGESGIVGAGIPVATGAGLSAQVRGTDQVVVCFFGDGASNQGTFHESLNMAAIWKLPVIYFCENNGYAATTAASDSTSVEDIADRAAGYGIPGSVVDGQDAVAVHAVTRGAVARARDGLGPSLVEAKTYRYNEHAEGAGIPSIYRSEEEIAQWRRRDPIEIHRRQLVSEGVLGEAQLRMIEAEVRAEIDAAVEFALASEFPDPAEAFEGLYANPPAGARVGGGGTPR